MAPIMNDSPWAKWGMFITPKISASPTDMSAHIPPVTSVLMSWAGPPWAPINTSRMKQMPAATQAGMFLRNFVFRFARCAGCRTVLVPLAVMVLLSRADL